jgi:hypothetical protein
MQIHVSILVTDNDLIIEQAGNLAPREDQNTTREPISNSAPHEDLATDLPAGIRHLCFLNIIMSSANYAPNI